MRRGPVSAEPGAMRDDARRQIAEPVPSLTGSGDMREAIRVFVEGRPGNVPPASSGISEPSHRAFALERRQTRSAGFNRACAVTLAGVPLAMTPLAGFARATSREVARRGHENRRFGLRQPCPPGSGAIAQRLYPNPTAGCGDCVVPNPSNPDLSALRSPW